jgi:hypothetical protein
MLLMYCQMTTLQEDKLNWLILSSVSFKLCFCNLIAVKDSIFIFRIYYLNYSTSQLRKKYICENKYRHN